MDGLINAIFMVSPEIVRMPPEMTPVVAMDSVKALPDVIAATTDPAAMLVPETLMPTTTPAIDETPVTDVVPEPALAVGVTVAVKQCPAANNSDLKLVAMFVVIAILKYPYE
jgi:hypothetical protein